MKSIRTKIVLTSCLICICSILLATTISYKILSDNIKEQTYYNLEEIAKKNAAEIEGWFSIQASKLKEIYDEIIYRNDFDKNNLIKYFNYKNQNNPDVKEYYIALKESVFIRGVGLWYPDRDYNLEEREWYKNAIESDDIAVSSPYVDSNHGEVIITFSKAIRIGDEVIGVLASDIAIDHIVGIVDKSNQIEGGYGFIVDNNGNILAHPNKEFLFSKDRGLTSVEEVYGKDISVKYFGKKRLDSIIDYDNKEKFLLYTDLGFIGWHIGIAVSVDTVMQPLSKMVNNTISLSIILTLISVGLTFILGNSISKPIKVATDYIEHMATLDISQDIDKEYMELKDEIGRMFNAFQKIVSSLRDFLGELTTISERVSTFSDELAALSHQSSIDTDNIAQNSINFAESNAGYNNNLSKIILSLESLLKKAEDLVNSSQGLDMPMVSSIEDMAYDMKRIYEDLSRIKDMDNFKSTQLKDIYSLIEKQTLIMEEIASASQCLAELGDELNIYISKFKR